MRVLIAPDSFAGTLSATEAADAIASGWTMQAPDDELDLAPMSDGGPGFVHAMATSLGIHPSPVEVRGPLRSTVRAAYAYDARRSTAYVESALCCGLDLIPDDQRDPTVTTSRGVGECIDAAIAAGAKTVVVGLGGTSVCDGGAGMLAALGATAVDESGRDRSELLSEGGGALGDVRGLDLDGVRRRVADVRIVVASDVDSPLLGPRGSAHGFATQKGATPEQVEFLEGAMGAWAAALGTVPSAGVSKDVWVLLGAGAGGGIGAALLALGAQREPGIDVVMTATRMAERAMAADLVVTGEGCFDWQSLRGKVVTGVAAAGLAAARPVVVIAGQVEVGRREWLGLGISGVYAVCDVAGSVDLSRREPARWLGETSAKAARSWSRGLQMRT